MRGREGNETGETYSDQEELGRTRETGLITVSPPVSTSVSDNRTPPLPSKETHLPL